MRRIWGRWGWGCLKAEESSSSEPRGHLRFCWNGGIQAGVQGWGFRDLEALAERGCVWGMVVWALAGGCPGLLGWVEGRWMEERTPPQLREVSRLGLSYSILSLGGPERKGVDWGAAFQTLPASFLSPLPSLT